MHRLREVAVLIGYTRFDYVTPDVDGEYDIDLETAKLGLNSNWVPAIENCGEGLFIQFNKAAVEEWQGRQPVRDISATMVNGLINWCTERNISERKFFGAAYDMLHSLSYMLINAISLECGYPASSIKERTYSNSEYDYGILLYTAASDSYGTLGGLANAARSLDQYLKLAMEMSKSVSWNYDFTLVSRRSIT